MCFNNVLSNLTNSQVRVAISHGAKSPYIVQSTQMSSLYTICDGMPHEIVVKFMANQLQLVVDGREDVTLFTPGTPLVNARSSLYVGGVPGKCECHNNIPNIK